MHKFSKKNIPYAFIGYSHLHKGYRCLDPISNQVYISPHVVFNEACFSFIKNESSSFSHNLSITTFPNHDKWSSREQLKSFQLEGPSPHQPPTNSSTKAHQIDLEDAPQDSIPLSSQTSTSLLSLPYSLTLTTQIYIVISLGAISSLILN